MISSKALIEKMQNCSRAMLEELHNPRLTGEVQIDDINLLCWAMVELALKLQDAVRQELTDLE